MNAVINARVFRFDPQEDQAPRYDNYAVPAEEPMSVLVLLNRIQQELDPALSYRKYCCGLQMCRSCLMKINQKRRFACLTMVDPGQEVIIEPLTYPQGHIKDLITRLEEDCPS